MTKRSNTFLFFCLLVVFIFCSLGFANRGDKKATNGLLKPTVENQFTLSGNNWAFEMTNYGSYAQDLEGRLPGGGSGGEFPKGTGTYVIFAAGIQIGAMVNGVPKVSAVEFDSEFQPGALLKTNAADSNEVPVATDYGAAVNKVFALYKDGSDGTPLGTNGDDMDDYANWPSQYGAPTKPDGSPLVIGDLMSWCVYNDMARDRHKVPDDSQKDPLGLEVQQASIQVNIAGYSDVFFMYYKIINKGTQNLSDVYIAAWFDADVDKSGNDLVATDTVRAISGTADTVRNMVFTYNSDNTDPVSGGGSAYGADFFQGPVVPGDPTDVAKYLELTQDGFVQREVPGKKVLGLSATVRYINVRGPSGDPDNDAELYNLMKGLEKNGDVKTNIFAYPADPLTASSGDPNLDPTPDDKRMMLSTGPFNLSVGDTQIVVLACVGGKGADKDDAVRNLRLTDVIAQKAYDNKFILPPPPPSPNLTATPLNGRVVLQWDDSPELNEDRYPELVNVTIPGYVTRDFAGYKVYRSPSGTVGSWTLLAQYDKKDGITEIPETTWIQQDVSIKEIKITKIGDDKGLRYTYTDENVTNEQQYYYSVTSYDAQPNIRSGAAPVTLESANSENSVRTVPRDATLGNVNIASANAAAEHVGPSDGSVAISVVDPTMVTGDSYKIEFENVRVVDTVNAPADTSTILMWKLYDITKSAYTKFFKGDDPNTNIDESYYQTNQASETDAASLELFTLVDGLKIQMFGPPNGMKDYDIPNGERKWTWVGGDYFALEGFSGAMGWGGSWTDNIGYSSVAPDEIRNVLIKFATTDSNGIFDPADTNVSYGYRYMRKAGDAPAKPEFAPYILNPTADQYAFQIYEKNVPFAAYNTETTPPTRLMVGFLENNTADGRVDGRYWPPASAEGVDNALGAREWFFIYDVPYSETSDPTLTVDILNEYVPLMWWGTPSRRGATSVSFASGDEFLILANHINTVADTFSFTTTSKPAFNKSLAESRLNKNHIKVVPNPYYGFSSYDRNQFSRQVKITGLPDECTIRIFNVAGDLVRTIQHNGTSTNDRASDPTAEFTSIEIWDLTTNNGLFVSSGVYFIYIDAPGIGKTEKPIPFAIIQGNIQLTVPTN